MSTQFIDGTFTDTKPFAEAMEEFKGLIQDGAPVKSLLVGSWGFIAAEKKKVSVESRLDELEQAVRDMSPVKSDLIEIPTVAEIKNITRSNSRR